MMNFLRGSKSSFPTARAAGPHLGDEGRMPDLGGAVGWQNSVPLSRESLHGKVVLVDIWTYSCINSLRQLPYLRGWAAKYKDAGLVVIGVHSPEFGFEKDRANVERAVREMGVSYPIAIDSNQGVWRAFNNQYWPADYFIDAKGRIRHHHFGEGDYDESERVIQDLLKENGATGFPHADTSFTGSAIEAAPNWPSVRSRETYVGFNRAENFASPQRVSRGSRASYTAPARLSLNEWALSGAWTIDSERGVLESAPGKILFRFHSRDLHCVLAPTVDGKPVRFRVSLDGAAPGDDHGADTAPDGAGEIREPRLHQLIRQKGDGVEDRTFGIEFLDPGVQAYVFTFG